MLELHRPPAASPATDRHGERRSRRRLIVNLTDVDFVTIA
jgi:hypothetical protein